MKIIRVAGDQDVYSSNVYLVMGEWKRIEDLNTLIDVGNDPSIVHFINNLNTGLGKKKIDQVILTHNHSDHTGILSLIKETFHPVVYAFSPFLDGVDHVLGDGEQIHMGDSLFEVIHTPGHSSDSISLFNKETGVIFVGDAPVVIRSGGGAYEQDFYMALKSLSKRNIQSIYFGHGEPVLKEAKELITMSLKNVRKSLVAKSDLSIMNN